ncbi:TolB family protein [Mesoterricola sediminis]|uniref:TolB protein n=1 Tax=Mesoterricola sediminis TaxID=2927980 RepID=A0AA48GSR2_9BACT|nr:hypothetical protein [Mesoterricola sediminis]BDU78581.1 hypothetical protein METESE_35390 [Mesoterricola sediminis]
MHPRFHSPLPVRLALAAAALALVAGCGGGPASQASAPPPAYEVIFDGQNPDGSRMLYYARPEGGAPQVLGRGYLGTRPQARPDGLALVYASLPTETAPMQLMLVTDLSQPALRLSPPGVGEREGAWSPDGTRLAFHSQQDEPDGDIFVARLRDGALEGRTNLTPRQPGDPEISPDVTPAWSPDGTRLAFTSYRSGSPALWVMAADGTQARQLTPTSATHGDYFPTWSPDGQWIAFQRLSQDAARIGLLPADGGSPAFFDFDGRAYAPSWSPDGQWIAFSGLRDGETDIYLQAPHSPELRRIVRPGVDQGPSWMRRRTP